MVRFFRRVKGPLPQFALSLLTLMRTKVGSDGEILGSIGNIKLIALVIVVEGIISNIIVLDIIYPCFTMYLQGIRIIGGYYRVIP